MDFRDRIDRIGKALGGEPHADGVAELYVGDPRFDDWEAIEDFSELEAARAFRQNLTERGQDCVLTSDWPLDEFGRGEISLRVPPGSWSRAEEMLEPE